MMRRFPVKADLQASGTSRGRAAVLRSGGRAGVATDAGSLVEQAPSFHRGSWKTKSICFRRAYASVTSSASSWSYLSSMPIVLPEAMASSSAWFEG